MEIDLALAAVQALLKRQPVRRRDDGGPEAAAIRSVWRAVDETRMFMAKVNNGEATLGSPNPHLVELWRDASLAIAAMDSGLSRRLRMKSEYWSDPSHWSSGQFAKAKIGLDEIAEEARNLLSYQATPSTESRAPMPNLSHDVFISHASEDKPSVARPLAKELQARGYRVWLDEFSLTLGDSLREEIDKGLRTCQFGVVILSPSFFSKRWPQQELNGLFSRESADGSKRILPVHHNMSAAEIAQHSPMVADRLGISTSSGIGAIADAIEQALAKRSGA